MTSSHRRLRALLAVALMTALLALFSPLAVTAGPVPLSLGSLAVYLAAALLHGKRSALAVFLYLLLGLIGVPVFTGFSGGIHHLLGPTGGFLLGYLPCALLSGWMIARLGDKPLVWTGAFILGTLLLYLCGTGWYAMISRIPVTTAIPFCVFPFLPGDAIKIAFAVIGGLPLKKLLVRHRYLP